MSSLSHPAPWAPRKRVSSKVRHSQRPQAAPSSAPAAEAQAGAAQTANPSPYTRSALPLALSWFVAPAILLVVSLALKWWI